MYRIAVQDGGFRFTSPSSAAVAYSYEIFGLYMTVLSTEVSRPNPVPTALDFALCFGVKVKQSRVQVFTESLR